MKPLFPLLITALLGFHAAADPLGEFLFPPDLLRSAQEEVTLTDAQRQHIQEEADKIGARFHALQEGVDKEAGALAAFLKAERVESSAALAQLDKLLDAEREVKRAQIGFLIAVKNHLTPEQQAKLTAFRQAREAEVTAKGELQKRIVAKAERVRVGVEKVAAGGGETSAVAAIMEEVRALMDQGKAKEAEAAIDRALKKLGE